MKHLFKFSIFLVVSSAIILCGCKKDDDDDNATTPATTVLSAQIDGVPFSATMPIAQMTLGIIQIGGSNSAGSMQVLMSYDVTPGTYSVTENTEEAVYWDSGQDSYWPGTGAIIVSKHDVINDIIEGTFTVSLEEFSSSVVINITNGVFKVNYIEH